MNAERVTAPGAGSSAGARGVPGQFVEVSHRSRPTVTDDRCRTLQVRSIEHPRYLQQVGARPEYQPTSAWLATRRGRPHDAAESGHDRSPPSARQRQPVTHRKPRYVSSERPESTPFVSLNMAHDRSIRVRMPRRRRPERKLLLGFATRQVEMVLPARRTAATWLRLPGVGEVEVFTRASPFGSSYVAPRQPVHYGPAAG